MFREKRKKKYSIIVFFCVIFLLTGAFAPFPATAGSWSDFVSGALNFAASPFLLAINLFLYAILTALGWMLSVAVTTLEWAVNPVSVKAMFDLPVIYTLWQMIRDFFNLFFILTLLFIAFATIFQIDSFNYKKTLGKLLLMALLVNFSFPISRFIIDTANVPMYFFMESMFADPSDKSIKKVVEVSLSASQIKEILLPKTTLKQQFFEGSTITLNLVIAIVFSFIFFSSLLSLSIAFAIRNIVLLILVIFSAVGFAGMVIPGFRKTASMWWDKLLKNAFFGPAAMLMLLISVKVMENLNAGGTGSIKDQINSGTLQLGAADLSRSVAAGSIVIIPIILIWMAMGVGQYIGAEGAGMARNWAMKTSLFVTGAAAMRRRYDSFRGEMKKRSDDKYAKNNIGTKLGTRANDRLDQISASRVGGRFETATARQARERLYNSQNARVDAAAKEHGVSATRTTADLRAIQQQHGARDANVNAAVIRELTNRGEATREDLEAVRTNFQDIGGVQNTVARAVEQSMLKYDPQAVHTRNGQLDEAGLRADVRANGLRSATLSTDAVANSADYFRIAAEEGRLTPQNREAIRARGDEFRDAVTNTLDATIDQFEENLVNQQGPLQPDQQRRQDTARRNLHSSFYAQTGRFHDVTASDQVSHMRAEVFSRANGDIMRRSQGQSIDDYADEIADNMPPGRVVDIIQRMFEENPEQARNLIGRLRTTAGTQGNANADAVRNMVDRQNGHNAIRHLD